MNEVVSPILTSVAGGGQAGVARPVSSPRYHGLDGVRVAAMLLGVFYHLPISMMTGGFGMGFGFGNSPKVPIDNWLHSFRMPLFFLVSGFFANMMLGKYGLKRYLTRRWWRIGAPLFIAIFAFAGLRLATDYFQPAAAPAFGAPGAANFGFGTAPGIGTGAGPFNAAGVTPFGGGGAVLPLASPTFGGPTSPAGTGGYSPPGPALSAPGVAPAMFATMPVQQVPSRRLADGLFNSHSRHFNLEHLWFLWYLLIFVTVAPAAVQVISWLFARGASDYSQRVGQGLIRFNLLALVLGLMTLPALLHGRGVMGWTLANPIGFLAPFPDFLFQYQADLPFYFLYFLAGWWLYRLRDGLSGLAGFWLWNLVLGVVGFAIAQSLSATYAQRPESDGLGWIRLGAFALYSVGAAYTAFGFIGFFQRYLDRPTRPGRYLADTILWVYLVHLPLIPYLLWWIQPSSGAWWSASLAGVLVVTAVALVLYELLIRPTPLVHIFGPPQRKARTQ